jgi:hypothetical protein
MSAVAYLLCYAIALTPGLPLGFRLFGRKHAAGWIAGAAIGYFLTSVALWIPIRTAHPTGVAFAIVWVAVAVASVAVARRLNEPLVTLPAWGVKDTSALIVVLLIVLAIAIPPFVNVGATDREGNRAYRAYFTADFVWHQALTAEMSKFASPPRNPYLATRTVHYYWSYFLLPAVAAGLNPGSDRVGTFLKVNAVGTALLFVSTIFLVTWTAVPNAKVGTAAIMLVIVASSAEGLYALLRLWQRGAPLADIRNLNVDAIANWWYGGLRIDGLQRCFWWVPQHSMAYALGLVALSIVIAAGSTAPPAAIAIAGIALAGSVAMNPFVGGVFALTYGITVVIDVLRSGFAINRLLLHAIAAIPVVLALAWCTANQMVEGAGGALQVGWLGDARNAPIATLFLSLGPALVTAAVAVAVGLRDARHGALVAPIVLVIVSLLLMYFVRLRVDASWVGFRAGQMFLVAVPPLIAAGLAAHRPARTIVVAIALVAALIGLPTTIVDAYNAQDISNLSPSPNGPWTIIVTRDERDGLNWLRAATSLGSIVQMDPIARTRQTWSLIPSFAERRMAAGLPISLLDMPEYHEKSARVRTMYETTDPQLAWSIAHALRIDYIYIDRVERTAYPAGMDKFGSDSRFEVAYRNSEVSIYRVR